LFLIEHCNGHLLSFVDLSEESGASDIIQWRYLTKLPKLNPMNAGFLKDRYQLVTKHGAYGKKKENSAKAVPIEGIIAVIALLGITASLLLRFIWGAESSLYDKPLIVVLVLGGIPILYDLAKHLLKREFGSDLLAGISIVTAAILGEYLAGTIIVLMLSGGETLESFAVGHASSALDALARRMPTIAHRQMPDKTEDIALTDVKVGDVLLVFPHEICPVDGIVTNGHSVMDESYLTGEPYMMPKTPGSEVISGSVNGDGVLTINAVRLVGDSRYAKIMEVMRESEQRRPHIRRLADQLGAWYTPIAVVIAVLAWVASADPTRFLATIVIATPCPLLIAIPTAVIGAISLAARRSIIIRDPTALEQVSECRTIILDKTGTLTYGRAALVEELYAAGLEPKTILSYAASLEKYSKHPLAEPIGKAAAKAGVPILEPSEISEKPGEGIRGLIDSHIVEITGRRNLEKSAHLDLKLLPPVTIGLECVVLIDRRYAATFRFHDAPRSGTKSFIEHLSPLHAFEKIMIVSGDRKKEVEYLARKIGINEIYAEKSPEEKVSIVREETGRSKTLFIGDGINDAPAMVTSTVGLAFGRTSDVTISAAKAVIMDSTLLRVDEFLHISKRFRRIALQSALGGMALSFVGMIVAAFGYLPPVAGAIGQEIIDFLAVSNALRVSLFPGKLTDY
jgi:heavy metal translocating P-type ATPase